MSFNMSQPGNLPTLDLKFWRDFGESLRIVKDALLQTRWYLFVLIGLSVVEGVSTAMKLRIPFVGIVLEMATLYIGCSVIWLAYGRLNPEFKEPEWKDTKGVEARLVSVGFIYSLQTFFYFLWLIAPGIWFATRASLAAVFVCLENCQASEAIKRSQELTKGHFWLTFRYMVGQPSLIAVGSFLAYVGLIFALGFIFHTGEDIPSYVEAPLSSLYVFAMTIFQLSVLPLMVRMYVVLSKNKLAPVSAAVSPSVPFEPAKPELDPKLNPRWEP